MNATQTKQTQEEKKCISTCKWNLLHKKKMNNEKINNAREKKELKRIFVVCFFVVVGAGYVWLKVTTLVSYDVTRVIQCSKFSMCLRLFV